MSDPRSWPTPQPETTPETTPAPAPVLEQDPDWQRLDPRMLLVQPVREVGRFIIPLLAFFVAGTATQRWWQYLFVVVPVALGLARYLTTSYRISAGRVELRRGLLSRHVLSTPLDRVRTVDLTSPPLHRLLGLTTIRIGTGQGQGEDSDQLDLDGLPTERARELRGTLMRVVATPVLGDHEGPADPASVDAAVPLVEFDLRWLRFAPFTTTGLVVVAAVFGGIAQLINSLDLSTDVDAHLPALPSVVAVVAGLVVLLVVVLALSVLGFFVTNGNFRLTRQHGSWHVRRGLITTRETSIDEDRLAGVAIGEPLALRVAGGRHLLAIVTGVNRSETGSSMLVPPSDADVAPRVARAVLGSRGPVDGALTAHGPAAARRRWTRALLAASPAPAAAVLVVVLGGPWWPLVPAAVVVACAAALAADRVTGLGHALHDGHVVARSGSLTRRREALGVDHVIGWTFTATWFQRRVGLTTLVATTAGGRGAVTVPDVPESDAVGLADAAVPGLVSQFRS